VLENSIALTPITVSSVEQAAGYLQNFESENRGEEFWRTRLNHWWEGNPFSHPDLPRGWMLTEEDQENVLGIIGLIPLPYRAEGRDITAFGATNWRINSECRGATGIRLLNQLRDLSEEHLVFDTSPTPAVEKLLRYVDFQRITQNDLHQVTFIVNARANISRLYNNRLWRITSKLAHGTVDVILGAVGADKLWDAAKTRPPKISSQTMLENGAVDDLWQRTQDMFTVTKARTGDYLRWYCFGNDRYRGKSLFVAGNDSANGLGVFYQRRVDNLNDLYCLDLWPPGNEDAAASIAVQAILQARRQGLDTVTIPLAGAARSIANRLSSTIMTVTTPLPSFGWFRAPNEITNQIKNESSFISKGEGDYGL